MDRLVSLAERQPEKPDIEVGVADTGYVDTIVGELEEVYGELFDRDVVFQDGDYAYDFSNLEAVRISLKESYANRLGAGIVAGGAAAGGAASIVIGDGSILMGVSVGAGGFAAPILFQYRMTRKKVSRGGSYFPLSRTAVISPERKPKHLAAECAAAELFHLEQYRASSPTRDHTYLREGFERASKITALERLETDAETLGSYADFLKSETAIYGLAKLDNFFETAHLDDADIPSEIKTEAIDNIDSCRVIYDIGACATFSAEEEEGPTVYADVFSGEYGILPDWFDEFTANYDEPVEYCHKL